MIAFRLPKVERWNDVIALNNRYPQDMHPRPLQLNAELAASALQQSEHISQDLRSDTKDFPNAVKMLLDPEPKPVKPDNDGIAIGDKYEAWL